VRSGVTHFHHGDWSGWRLRLNATALAWRFGFLSCSNCAASRRKPLTKYSYSTFSSPTGNPFAISRSASASYIHCARVHGLHGWGQQRNQSAVAPLCRVPTGNLIWNDLREHYGTSIRQTSCRHVRYSCARPNRSILGSFRARPFLSSKISAGARWQGWRLL